MLSLLFFLTTARRRADAGALEGRHGAMNPAGGARGGKCPYCSEVHEISVRETYINGALQDATDRLRRSI
jgi:hypothetical protein